MSSQYVKLGDRSLDQWKVTELREELKRRQLATKGLKEELLRRLDEAVRIERENSAESVENDEHDENDANQSELPFEEAKTESDISGGTKDFMDVGISMDEKTDAKPEHETDDHMSLFEGYVEVSLEQGTKIAELEGTHNAQIAAVETTVVINETGDTVTDVSGQPLDNDGINEDGDSTAVSNNDGLSHVQEDAKLELCDPETQLPMNTEGSTPVVPSGEPNLEDSGTQDEALHSTDQMETDDPKHLQPDSNVQPLKYQVSEVVETDLGFQVTSDSVSTESVTIFEKNELKVDVITDNVQLELDAMNEMAQQLPSSVLPDGGESHPLDVAFTLLFFIQKFQLIVEYLWHEDTEEQYKATRQFRELHSTEPSPPIKDFIQSGVVPRLVEFLCEYKIPSLQFEAAWALTNIASGTSEDATAVIAHGAVPLFIMLLSSQVDYVREQAVWALGNIAADSPNHRDLVLREEAVNPLLSLMVNEDSSVHMLRIATWTLLNFCRGEPQHPFDALPTLAFLIKSNDDEEVLSNACWALSYLLDGRTDKIQAVIDSGICPRVVQLLRHASPSVLIPALRTVGNIVTGNDEQTQVIIDHQALPCLLTLLDKVYDKSIRKQACWAISNTTAGNEKQIQAVIDANIFGRLVDLLQNTEFEIESEAAWAITNATSGGSDDQITRIALVENCILHLCDLLDCQDPEILEVCLEALENIVKVGEIKKKTYGENIFAMLIDSAGGGFIRLVNLGTSEAGEITKIRNWLLDTYWVHDNSGYLSEIATSDVPFEPILRAGATMKKKKRKFPCRSPFPLTRGVRLNGVLLRVEFKLSRDHRMVRTLNTYFEETRSCKRIKISERPSSERDHIDVIIKYYKGTVINDWTAPTTDVVDLNEPKERKILIHLPTSGASNANLAKSLSEMGAPADAYEDAMGMLTKWLMVQTLYLPLPTCLEIYDMELIDPIAMRSWSFLPDRVIDSTRFPGFGD